MVSEEAHGSELSAVDEGVDDALAAGLVELIKTSWPRRRPSTPIADWEPVEDTADLSGRRDMKEPTVYILASKRNGILYVGVTGSLEDRMAEHDQALIEVFTKRYGVRTLVYYEFHDGFEEAIRRETQIKKWKRAWKVRLIEGMNPEWSNLFDPTTGEIHAGPADVARGFEL
jgi:putative endonuclease